MEEYEYEDGGREGGAPEKVETYDQEVSTKAWDHLASSPNDGEDKLVSIK